MSPSYKHKNASVTATEKAEEEVAGAQARCARAQAQGLFGTLANCAAAGGRKTHLQLLLQLFELVLQFGG
ncbi:hypothetical protein Ct61P_06575 [Colletotrichum tofieldiae]|nr:hypothetical protein Ct61P_06575 [Colletotrichum tofieldiae]